MSWLGEGLVPGWNGVVQNENLERLTADVDSGSLSFGRWMRTDLRFLWRGLGNAMDGNER